MESGPIEFQDVSFAYPSRPAYPVLKGISLLLAAGKFTAIVGASGSGKSTIGGLITRLYDPSSGSIFLGKYETSMLNVRYLRRCVGVVDQDPAILCCSIFENIAFGAINASSHELGNYEIGIRLSQITQAVRNGRDFLSVLEGEPLIARELFRNAQEAAILADAHPFIQDLQYGYATLVGSAMFELSGGQKQRLALARVFMKNPPILLLDEATSALDSASEQRILNSLTESRKGLTTIVIAHRLSTIRDADHIVVMQDGVVLEGGTHQELLLKDATYTSMIEAQSLNIPALVSAEPSETSTAIGSLAVDAKHPKSTKRTSFRSLQRPSFRRGYSKDKARHDDKWSSLKMFASFIRPQILYLALGLFGALVAGGAYSGDAVIFGTTIGNLNPCQGAPRVRSSGNLAGLLFIILALAAFIAHSVGGSAFGRIAEKIVFQVRIRTFRSLFQKDVLWHSSDGRTPALLLSYFTSDTNSLAGLSGVVLGTILTILVNLIASLLMTHIIAWKIAIVLLATLPILLGSGFMRLYALAKFQARHQKLYAVSAGISLEAVASIKTIASYSLEEGFYKRYCHSLKEPYKTSIREFAYTNFWLATAYSVSMLIYALAYWWGAKQITAGIYSQTQFFIVLPALLFSAQSCGQMFALAPDVSNARVAAARLFGMYFSQQSILLFYEFESSNLLSRSAE